MQMDRLFEGMDRDDKESQYIQGCIDAICTFDETRREQTYYRQIIKDSYGWLLNKKCKFVQQYTLENQLPDLAMKLRKLDLGDSKNCLNPDFFESCDVKEEDEIQEADEIMEHDDTKDLEPPVTAEKTKERLTEEKPADGTVDTFRTAE